jgi:hypothetical protein
MTTTKKHPPTVRRGPVAIAVTTSFAAVLGSAVRRTSARPAAAGTPSVFGPTGWVFVSGGRSLPLESLPLYVLGHGRARKQSGGRFSAPLALPPAAR